MRSGVILDCTATPRFPPLFLLTLLPPHEDGRGAPPFCCFLFQCTTPFSFSRGNTHAFSPDFPLVPLSFFFEVPPPPSFPANFVPTFFFPPMTFLKINYSPPLPFSLPGTFNGPMEVTTSPQLPVVCFRRVS